VASSGVEQPQVQDSTPELQNVNAAARPTMSGAESRFISGFANTEKPLTKFM
jgi:hypothetical protein